MSEFGDKIKANTINQLINQSNKQTTLLNIQAKQNVFLFLKSVIWGSEN